MFQSEKENICPLRKSDLKLIELAIKNNNNNFEIAGIVLLV